MQGYNPILNLNAIKRKQKGITKELGGLSVGYYRLMTQGVEGQVVKINNAAVDANGVAMADVAVLLAGGDAALAFGFLMQNVIDDSTYGQLQGTHMPNDTRARPGDAVGILTGTGYAATINYEGTGSKGNQVYYNVATGKLSANTALGVTNALPAIFTQDFDASVNGDNYDSTVYTQPTRISFDFPVATGIGQVSIANAGVSTVKIAAGAVTTQKLDLSTVKTLVAAGVAATGPVTLAGAAVGDRVVSILGTLTAGGPLVTKGATAYETTISVAGQIQQLAGAGDLHLSTFAFILIPAAA